MVGRDPDDPQVGAKEAGGRDTRGMQATFVDADAMKEKVRQNLMRSS